MSLAQRFLSSFSPGLRERIWALATAPGVNTHDEQEKEKQRRLEAELREDIVKEVNNAILPRFDLYETVVIPESLLDTRLPAKFEGLLERLREKPPTVFPDEVREFNRWLLDQAFLSDGLTRVIRPCPLLPEIHVHQFPPDNAPGAEPESEPASPFEDLPGLLPPEFDRRQVQKILDAMDAVRFGKRREAAMATILRLRYSIQNDDDGNQIGHTFQELGDHFGAVVSTMFAWTVFAESVFKVVNATLDDDQVFRYAIDLFGESARVSSGNKLGPEVRGTHRAVLRAYWVREKGTLLAEVDRITEPRRLGTLLKDRYHGKGRSEQTLEQERKVSSSVIAGDLAEANKVFCVVLLADFKAMRKSGGDRM